jgi:hypothetical protein
MFGFGKLKFWKSKLEDALYIKTFYMNQVMPSTGGWILHHFPHW